MRCFACPNDMESSERIDCACCKKPYHFRCVNITTAEFMSTSFTREKADWRCPVCRNITSRPKRDNTPVGKTRYHADIDMSMDALSVGDSSSLNDNVTTHEEALPYSRFEQLLKSQQDALFSKIDLLKHQLAQEMLILSERVAGLELENKHLRDEVEILKKNQNMMSEPVMSNMQEAVSKLQQDLNEREQSTLLNDVEVTGIPEAANESCIHLVLAVAKRLDVEMEERDIVSVSRAGPRRSPLPDAAGRPPLPRPLVVRFARRALRDQIIKHARVRRGATTADIGLPLQPRPFHINERLTKKNRSLFGKAREMGRTQRWRFVWTSEGRVLARQADGSRVYQIRDEKDLDIFQTDNK